MNTVVMTTAILDLFWTMAHFDAANCDSLEVCIQRALLVTGREEAATICYRLWVLGFPTMFEIKLVRAENRPYTLDNEDMISHIWQLLWRKGAELVISNIEEWQFIVMKKLTFAGYGLIRAKSGEHLRIFGHIDRLDTTRVAKQWYYQKSKDLHILPLCCPTYISKRDQTKISLDMTLLQIMEERPDNPTPQHILDSV